MPQLCYGDIQYELNFEEINGCSFFADIEPLVADDIIAALTKRVGKTRFYSLDIGFNEDDPVIEILPTFAGDVLTWSHVKLVTKILEKHLKTLNKPYTLKMLGWDSEWGDLV